MDGESGRPVWRPSPSDTMTDNLDEKLAAALHDVPVPEGLAERLLDRLKNAELTATDDEGPPGRRSRVILSLSFGAAAAVLLVAVWLGLHRDEGISQSYALDEAIRSFQLGSDEPGPLLASKPAPAAYPFSPAVIQLRGTRWRLLETFLGRRGIVYDLPGPVGTTASLYVVDAAGLEGFDPSPTLYPFTTAGCCAASWQEDGRLYILVVQGDPSAYRAYLNVPRGPVACVEFAPRRSGWDYPPCRCIMRLADSRAT